MSPFLEIPETDWLAANALAFAFYDRYPVSPGHTLIVTRRLVPNFFEATLEEQRALLDLAVQLQHRLSLELAPRPDGWNVGFNCGAAAGQTVFHLQGSGWKRPTSAGMWPAVRAKRPTDPRSMRFITSYSITASSP